MSYPTHLYGNGHCRQTNPEVAKNREMRKMFICSVQTNISYNKNAHILRLSFLFSILFASANSHFCVLSMLVRMQTNRFCHSRKTGYLIHLIQYILGRLVLFFIFSFPFVVQFDLLSLQIIYNYSKLSKLT